MNKKRGKMNIALLVLHIMTAILFGACAVKNTNIITEILYIICSVLNGVMVGLDISSLALERINK